MGKVDSMAGMLSRSQWNPSTEYPPKEFPKSMFAAIRKELSGFLASPHSMAVRRFSCSASERCAQGFLFARPGAPPHVPDWDVLRPSSDDGS